MSNALRELTRIISAVSYAGSPAEQVTTIVDSICQAIGTDVCSLYKVKANGDLALLASHGLDNSQPVVIPAGMGLVGNIVKNRHTLNVANAPSHPDYYYIPTIGEEDFHSFCGAPLVDQGSVAGVLVVQKTSQGALDEEDEAFLATLSSHLAIIIRSLPDLDSQSALKNKLQCIPGSPGIGIGEVVAIKSYLLDEVKFVNCLDPAAEKVAWHALVEKVQIQLDKEKIVVVESAGASIEGVFTAFQLFLKDKAFTDLVEQGIEAGYSLPSALKKAVAKISAAFEEMDDLYLQARAEDIWHLGNRLYEQWLDEPDQPAINVSSTAPMVLVARHIDISDIASYAKFNLVGIVSGEGSALSHVSVIANALGIPALLGVASQKMPATGDKVIVDGNEGSLIISPSKALLREYAGLVDKQRSLNAEFETVRQLPACTTDGHRVSLYTNTGLLADLAPGLKYGAEGVGLYRTEIPFLIRDSFPTEDEQVGVYKKVFEAYAGKPVYMRTLDVGGDKQLPYFPTGKEDNPALGWRGIRFTLDNVQLLVTQLRAMLRASVGHDGLHVLIPMVSATSEIDAFRDLLADALKQLREEGIVVKAPKIGVMVEVPAAISQIDFWRDKIDFISIGSNDLSQYLLAIDRNNFRVADRFDHVHPAIIHELYRIANAAKRQQLHVCVCGELGADPIAVALLLGMGISCLSLSSSRLPKIKYFIRHLSVARAEQFLLLALGMDNVKAIRQAGVELIKEIGLQDLIE